MSDFNLDDFIAGINKDRAKSADNKKRLNRMLMNSKTMQGSVNIIPIFSESMGNFYQKITNVYEFYGDSSKGKDGEGWFRVLPLSYYPDLSEEETELYNEVLGMLEWINDSGLMGYGTANEGFRVRNYTLMGGICASTSNPSQEAKKLVGCPCLFIFPSTYVINALGNAINSQIETAQGSKAWMPTVITKNPTGRQGAINVTFVKSDGPGYDVSMGFQFNNSALGLNVVDPNMVIEDEILSLFDNVMPSFLGWNYNNEADRNFDPIVFKELRDNLKLKIKELKVEGSESPSPEDATKEFDNKNNLESPEAKPEAKPQGKPF